MLFFQDYEELKVPLSDIPVNPGTCSELVRLCLRRQDVTDDKSDHSDVSEEVEEGEVVSWVFNFSDRLYLDIARNVLTSMGQFESLRTFLITSFIEYSGLCVSKMVLFCV